MKKILFLALILATFIAIFCLSSSAVDYGLQYLDPDYYEDDIGLVIMLEYDEADHIVIPLYQVRIPDSVSDEYVINIDGINWSSDYIDVGEHLAEVLLDISFTRNSQLENGNGQSLDLTNVELTNLDSYPILSSYWDDPYFKVYVDGELVHTDYASSFPYYYPDLPGYNGILFLSFTCDIWTGESPTYGFIPIYPPRPLPPDPPLPSGSISAILSNMFTYPIDLFEDITISTGTLTLFISAVGFVFFVRFILMPIFGVMPAGVSDSVKAGRSELRERRSERRMLRRADRNYKRSRR